jgi:anti-sigma-K factor RskA
MSHDELRELIPAYALSALGDDERPALETHLRECADCRALLAEYRRLSDDLLYAAPPVAAPAGLTEDLRRRIAAPASQREAERAPRFSLSSLRRRPAFGLTLAGLAALLLVGSNLYWAARTARSEREIAAVTALVQAPAITLTADGDEYGRGVLYRPDAGDVALLCVYGLQPLPQEKAYQVWLISGQERVSGGTFRVTDDGYGILLIKPPAPLQNYDGLGVTVEPAGGSPGPTTPRVLGAEL